MTETKPPPPPPGARGEKIDAHPGFAGALRGIWLLTWKSQFSWRRLPGRLAVLLVLPFLVWITTQSPEGWSQHHAELQGEWSRRSAPFYHWLVDVYFFIILPLSCVRGCGALMRDELQADTLGFLVTRPASRARLLCVKYLSQLAWLQILLLTETLLLFGVGAGRQIPELGGLLPLFVAVQLLAVPAWSALGTLLGQLTSRYMAIGLVYGAIVEMGIGRIPTNINALSIMRHLKTLLSRNEALQPIYDWPADGAWLSICALVIAPILFLGVAAVLFSSMEYLPASEMQK
jgi:ABC-type transport system involved in multi-copper enzyme maturation permease subunit